MERNHSEQCPTCLGKGGWSEVHNWSDGPGMVEIRCRVCQGTGTINERIGKLLLRLTDELAQQTAAAKDIAKHWLLYKASQRGQTLADLPNAACWPSVWEEHLDRDAAMSYGPHSFQDHAGVKPDVMALQFLRKVITSSVWLEHWVLCHSDGTACEDGCDKGVTLQGSALMDALDEAVKDWRMPKETIEEAMLRVYENAVRDLGHPNSESGGWSITDLMADNFPQLSLDDIQQHLAKAGIC